MIPVSTSIVVVTKKNINSKNAISAIELELISPAFLFFFAILDYDLNEPRIQENTAAKAAPANAI